ncbi:lanthionine synthetase LanC family protein [Microscilla marina]|uniref:Lanthionine synthetase C-like protein n=1 Tax=Microscilla marina ATCC 23134 TaxID=313606 RepID=A1ZEP5_MICM2|nr:lanthionine synthetase LanC family protein [Microscilla marina]EAY30997.1 conserved hypothetical protein [Microscilla marina ATCC 23134]
MHKNLNQVTARLVKDILLESLEANTQINVYRGSLGQALLFSLLNKGGLAPVNQDRLYDSITHCINNLQTLDGNASFSGYSGVLLTLSTLIQEGQLDKQEIQEVMKVLQHLVLDSIPYDFQNCNLDFLHGLIGKLIALTEVRDFFEDDVRSLIEANVIKGIEYVVDNAKYTNGEAEIFWETIATPEGIINTGLAHGLASIINFLAKAYNYDFIDADLKQKIQTCLSLACSFLINRKSSDHNHFTFANKLSVDENKLNTNQYSLAWCKGDLGIVFSLIAANKCLKSQKIDDIINSIIKKTAKVRKLNSGIHQDATRLDTTLCHGSFGAFFLFYLLYKHTQLPEAKDAYLYWLNESLSQADWDEKFLGWSHYGTNPTTGHQEWGQSSGLLFGATGQCLSLLSFLLVEQNIIQIQQLNWLKFLF